MEYLRIENTEYRSDGIVLEKTIAYTDSCENCKYNNLKCHDKEVMLETGNCLCMWRVDGAEPKLNLLQCARCVEDCIGKYQSFDLGEYMSPVQQKGMCLKKK